MTSWRWRGGAVVASAGAGPPRHDLLLLVHTIIHSSIDNSHMYIYKRLSSAQQEVFTHRHDRLYVYIRRGRARGGGALAGAGRAVRRRLGQRVI
jgi:hypothetical protein